ncbi:glycosyl hydrolase family 28-related protein [Haloarcula salina]|uniref:Right-handed parallel beta-helix repeat-containing protein n=1 Tax=Haloarcula salina TaxID=1429914 RepID=A0AA41KG55_9EURY|nr:glycosyl hydrolase family 28-related protein [Haloarcula salina]MBV0902727.1 right-handed parallel beta-helix repeat-containing protein [Haloarcula salina]
MSDGRLDRRKLLALLGATGVGTVALRAYSDGDPTGEPVPASETPTPRPAGERSRTPDGPQAQTEEPSVVDIRRYGARVDGQTDDTPAIRRALDAVHPGGVLQLPPGDILIDTPEDVRAAISLTDDHRNVTIRGSVDGETRSTLHMAPNQDHVHYAFRITGDSLEANDEIAIRNLTIDLHSPRQDTVGTAIRTNGANGTFTLRNCRIVRTRNSGVKMVGGMNGDIRNCRFEENGVVAYGHAISPKQSRRKTTTTIKNVFCTNQRGVSIDVGEGRSGDRQTVHIERCVLKDSIGGIKINPTAAAVTIRNTQILGGESTTIPVKMNPYDFYMGSVELDNVLIDGGGWPGIDFPNATALELHDVAIKNVDKNNESRGRDRGGIRTDELDFGSSGRISIHNVGVNNEGPALKIFEGSGSIDEVRHDGTGGLGRTEGVTVHADRRGGPPIEPDVPTESEVGLVDHSM